MSAAVYPVSRYFLGLPARLDVGRVLPLLQVDLLRACAGSSQVLSMADLTRRVADEAIAIEQQAHAMAWTLYLSLRYSRAGRLMDDTFLDASSRPVRYYVTPAGRAWLTEQLRSAA